MSKTFFVFGVRGVQGRPVAKALLAGGHRVVSITRGSDNRNELEALGVSAEVTNLRDVSTVGRIIRQCDGCFWHVPTGASQRDGLSAVEALIQILDSSIAPTVVSTSGVVPTKSEAGRAFSGVVRLADSLRELTDRHTVLRPTMFLEDVLDTWPISAIESTGKLRYPLPIAVPFAWVTADAVGRAAARILLAERWDPGWYAVVGDIHASVADLADRFSQFFGRSVLAERWELSDYADKIAADVSRAAAESTADVYRVIERSLEQLSGPAEAEIELILQGCIDAWFDTLS